MKKDMRHFRSDPGNQPRPSPANRPVSPAAKLLVSEDVLFDIDGDHYWVDGLFGSTHGEQADVIILRGVEYMRCPERTVRRAMQVRDLERLIEQDRVDIAFGPSAIEYNRRRTRRPRRDHRNRRPGRMS